MCLASVVSQRFHAEAGAALERGIIISLSERLAMVASTSCMTEEDAIELLKPTSAREPVCIGAHSLGGFRGCMHIV